MCLNCRLFQFISMCSAQFLIPALLPDPQGSQLSFTTIFKPVRIMGFIRSAGVCTKLDTFWFLNFGNKAAQKFGCGILFCSYARYVLPKNSCTYIYGPQDKVMFSQVSVCPQSASWILVHCSAMLRRGRYTSYWNAFLLLYLYLLHGSHLLCGDLLAIKHWWGCSLPPFTAPICCMDKFSAWLKFTTLFKFTTWWPFWT